MPLSPWWPARNSAIWRRGWSFGAKRERDVRPVEASARRRAAALGTGARRCRRASPVGGRREGERLDVAERSRGRGRARGIRGGNRAPIARRNAPRRWRAAVTPALAQPRREALGRRAARRDEEEAQLAAVAGAARPRRVSSSPVAELSVAAATPSAAHLPHLVAHQRDQRRDDDGQRRRRRSPAAGSTSTCRCRSASRRSTSSPASTAATISSWPGRKSS